MIELCFEWAFRPFILCRCQVDLHWLRLLALGVNANPPEVVRYLINIILIIMLDPLLISPPPTVRDNGCSTDPNQPPTTEQQNDRTLLPGRTSLAVVGRVTVGEMASRGSEDYLRLRLRPSLTTSF